MIFPPREAPLAPAELEAVERALHAACGFALSPAVRNTLAARVAAACADAGLGRAAFLAAIGRGDRPCTEALVEACVIAETYFFRQPEHFAALRTVAAGRAPDAPMSIWSAACATGEESYSIAIALLEAGRPAGFDQVLATDVSRRLLAAAERGRYGEWSLRRVDAQARARWFNAGDGHVCVKAPPRRAVRYACHNLATTPPPGFGFDVIVCRNVLIYFDAPTAIRVLDGMHRALAPGGLLLLGSAEAPLAGELPFELVEIAGAHVLRRLEERPRPEPRRAPRPTPPRPLRAVPARCPTPVPAAGPPGAAPAPVSAAARLAAAVAAAPPAAANGPSPEDFVLLGIDADARGDLEAAVAAMRRALYLDPDCAGAHAHLVGVFERLGRRGDAERSRANALAALEPLGDDAAVPGFHDVTAGALRSALSRGRTDRFERRSEP
jgi:chemotaxis protein methyltransferase CheR